MATIKARIAKTVQERQYEPFVAELEATYEYDSHHATVSVTEAARNLAESLEYQVDQIISARLNKTKQSKR